MERIGNKLLRSDIRSQIIVIKKELNELLAILKQQEQEKIYKQKTNKWHNPIQSHY